MNRHIRHYSEVGIEQQSTTTMPESVIASPASPPSRDDALFAAVGLSLLTHALLVGAAWLLGVEGIAVRAVARQEQGTLVVSLAPPAQPVSLTPHEPAKPLAGAASRPVAAPATPTARAVDSGTIIHPARFVQAPDFRPLEELALTTAGKLTVVLDVSAIGTVDAVHPQKHEPLPSELLAGIITALQQSRLQPARDTTGRAVPSRLEISVGFEPAATE